MIYLYSGTPGSGKSLHVARVIYFTLKFKKPVICNFNIDTSKVRHDKMFHYKSNMDITPAYLMQFSIDYFNGRRVKEDEITLVLDECQMMFNAREWSKKGREDWNRFFQMHRHYGYRIILIAQFDRMIDRQIRSLIEYEYIHRKVSNFGFKGRMLCFFMLSKDMFVCVRMWYPMKEKVSSEFFRARKKYYQLYDTYLVLPELNSE